MQTLTKREKTLLYILLCIIVIVGGIFLIGMPALEKYSELNVEYEAVKSDLIKEKGNIVTYDDLDKQIEEITKQYNEQVNKFYSTKMLEEDVDQLITAMAIEHGLMPTSLSITEISEESLPSYEEYLQNRAKNDGTTTEDGLKIKVYNVSLNITGSIKNLQALVNSANQSKSLKVSSVNYTNQATDKKEMTMTFKLFMN